MNIGDYVRTKDGIIAKCIKEECDRYVFDKIIVEDGYYHDYEYKDVTPRGSYIFKSSSNIIDLIEVGDYVNGYRITYIAEPDKYNPNRILYFEEPQDYVLKTFTNEEIKSVVTKEQFESMKYKIGE